MDSALFPSIFLVKFYGVTLRSSVSATFMLSCRKEIYDFENSDSASHDKVKSSQELRGDAAELGPQC